ncbi:hypothetical protein BJ875DRAFT_503059 [Amylocarpus encephaloides]|uniref:DUF3074 domain-containing protein n=1 Tax=Amylocarpus encephaloides TaxID=45428 RepID=A0A9P8C7Z7_9HELO|nr:hypothetical protein BJ875DRAFT_503059 [Amylocarpus encephaloides]
MTYRLGPWVRLEGVSFKQLPPGGKAPTIPSFVTSLLAESIPFIDGVAPKSGGATTWKVKGTPRAFPSSAAPVHLYEWTVPGKDLDQVEGMSQFSADRKDEYWCCRRSTHRNVAEKNTASWNEFVHNFKDRHAESEKAFTPTVIAARQALKWDTEGIEVEVSGERWRNISIAVEEMTHKINPKPLKNRTFPVVQLTADLAGTEEFLVVSIPLTDFDHSPYSEFTKDKSLVVAAYASVERVRVLPSNGDVEWIMATASNAKGVLPQWMQNLAVPSAIAKDVEFFMSWVPRQRESINKPTPISKTGDAPPPISKD